MIGVVFSDQAFQFEWSRTYGSSWKSAQAYSVCQTYDGGFVLVGSIDGDAMLVKTDSLGNMIWNKTFGGQNVDCGRSVIETTDKGFAFAGYSQPSYGNDDFWLVKTDSDGNKQWEKTFGGPAIDRAYSFVQTEDEGYLITGLSASFGAGNGDLWIAKTTSSGNLEWNKTLGGSETDYGNQIIKTSDNGYAIAGYTASFGLGAGDAWLVKMNSSRSIQWNQTYGSTTGDEATSVVETSNMGFALAGWTNHDTYGRTDFWLVKTNTFGGMQWSQTYGGSEDDLAHSLLQTGDIGFALVGSTYSFGPMSSPSSANVWLVKTDGAGNMQGNQTYGGTSGDSAKAIIQTNDSGLVFSGATTTLEDPMLRMWLVKIPLANVPELQLIVSVTVNPANVASGGQVSIAGHVSSGTRVVEGASVQFVSDKGGTFSPDSGSTNSTGDFATIFTAPTLSEQTDVRITSTASKAGYADGSGSEYVSVFLPGTLPLSVTVTANPSTIQSSQTSTITTRITAGTNPIADAAVTMSSDKGGTLSPTSGNADSSGYFTSTFTAPTVTTQTTITIATSAAKTGYLSGQSQTQITVNPAQQPDLTPWLYMAVVVIILIAVGGGITVARRRGKPKQEPTSSS